MDLEQQLEKITSQASHELQQTIQKLQKSISEKIKLIINLGETYQQQQDHKIQKDIKDKYLQMVLIKQNSYSPTSLEKLCIDMHRSQYGSCLNFYREQDQEIPIFKNEVNPFKKLSIKDFQILKKLGKGGYGEVYLAEKISTKDLVAIKVINKEHILKENSYDELQIEQFILGLNNQEFTVKGLHTFQGQKHLYFFMEYMTGGDLGNLLEKEGRFELTAVLFYIAQIIMCLENLHKQNIIHRDLKPQNVLLDQKGNCRLVDFGLSESQAFSRSKNKQEMNNKQDNGIRGTADYIAPEIILQQVHDEKVDV